MSNEQAARKLAEEVRELLAAEAARRPDDCENGQVPASQADEIQIEFYAAKAASLQSQLESAQKEIKVARETNKELNRRAQSLKHALSNESGRHSWYGYYLAFMQILKDDVTKLETSEAQNKLLKDALTKWLAVKWPKECSHGEEPWYCDCCRHDWEKELIAARDNAEAVLASIPGSKEDKHA